MAWPNILSTGRDELGGASKGSGNDFGMFVGTYELTKLLLMRSRSDPDLGRGDSVAPRAHEAAHLAQRQYVYIITRLEGIW